MLKQKLASGVCVTTTILSALLLSACGSEGVQTASVSKGTVQLAHVRVGTPEEVFKQAILTFVEDPNGSIGGKTQYISRQPDATGGQYVVQAKDDLCFEVSIVHATKPVTKVDALKTLEQLLPPTVVAENKPQIDDAGLKAAQPTQIYKFGKDFSGRLQYDKAGDVTVISASRNGVM